MTVTEAKKALRAELLGRRRAMSIDARVAADAEIAAQVTAHPAWAAAKQVFAYIAMPHEVGTRALLEAALASGKTLGLPVCNTATHEMAFYRLLAMDELQAGAYRIPVPPTAPERLLTPDADTLCIVPMLSFDADGYRLGAGGGYYDRFLSQYPVKTIGLCYAECKQTQLPREATDKTIDCCVTEQKTEVFYG